MNDNDNPYKAPESQVQTTAPEGDMYLPEPIRVPLLKAAPWMRFAGIVGFISSGIIALIGLFFVVGISAMTAALDMANMGTGMLVFMGLLYIGFAVLYFFPSLYLFNSGKALKAYQGSSSAQDLARSFTNTSKFWKFVGVLMIIYLAMMAPSLIILSIVGLAGGF